MRAAATDAAVLACHIIPHQIPRASLSGEEIDEEVVLIGYLDRSASRCNPAGYATRRGTDSHRTTSARLSGAGPRRSRSVPGLPDTFLSRHQGKRRTDLPRCPKRPGRESAAGRRERERRIHYPGWGRKADSPRM